MANKRQKQRQTLLMLSRPQLVALATQKKVLPYRDALAKTKGELIALMADIEGILKPVKTWADAQVDDDPVDDDAQVDDQRIILDLEDPGTAKASRLL